MIFIILVCGAATGVLGVDNASELVWSREHAVLHHNYTKHELLHHDEADALVDLFSIFNAVGRLSMGLFSDYLHNRMIARAWILFAALILMAISQFSMIRASLSLLYVFFSVNALAYGAVLCIAPVVCLELFGLKNFPTNLSAISLGLALGGFVLGSVIPDLIKFVVLNSDVLFNDSFPPFFDLFLLSRF
jgi:MFS family permease